MSDEQSNMSFYAYLSRMKYINRWGLMRNTVPENIQEHSLQVAVLAHALAIIHNKLTDDESEHLIPERACVYAAFHDVSEILTGDMPTPVKYFDERLRDSFKDLEDAARERLLNTLPEDMRGDYAPVLFFEKCDEKYYTIVKAADRLAAYIKCVEEERSGNREFTAARKTVLQSMHDMKCDALEYFTEHFLPSFELSLDELES